MDENFVSSLASLVGEAAQQTEESNKQAIELQARLVTAIERLADAVEGLNLGVHVVKDPPEDKHYV